VPTLTKAGLVNEIHNQLGLNKRESREFVDLFFDLIRGALRDGKQVKLSGFGNFYTLRKSQRPGRNPHTGEEVTIDARCVASFRQGQKLKKKLNPDDSIDSK